MNFANGKLYFAKETKYALKDFVIFNEVTRYRTTTLLKRD